MSARFGKHNGKWSLKATQASCLSWMRRQERGKFSLEELRDHGHAKPTVHSLLRYGLISTGTDEHGRNWYFLTKEGEKA